MTGRVVVELVADGSYRVVEADDGRLVHSWLPGVEDDDWLPLDRGGFDDHFDAMGFALGVDFVRAEAGMLDVSPAQIERERQALDAINPGRVATKSDPQDILDRFAARVRQWGAPDATLEGFAARALQRMREPEPQPEHWQPVSEPVIEHRRIRVG